MDFQIDKNFDGSRIDRLLREKFNIPQSLVSKLLREKKVKVNNKKAEISTRLQEGDTINIYYFLNEKPKKVNIPYKLIENFKQWIIFEDDEIIAINKPEGISSQGGEKASFGIDSIAKAHFVEARLTHRLDRETSGILILAKSKASARKFTTLFAQGQVLKTYKAIVSNKIPVKGTIQTDLQKNPKAQKMFATQGTSCTTHYQKAQESENFALVDVFPQTGKMHQIRVHLASIGFPILGDLKYNPVKNSTSRMLLHAFEISIDGKTFQAPLPEVFTKIMEIKD